MAGALRGSGHLWHLGARNQVLTVGREMGILIICDLYRYPTV
jgi:hypothetical protein